MKEKKPIPALLFYSIIFILFFVDLVALSLLERPLVYSILCFYILQLASPISLPRIITACTLLSFYPLLQFGHFGFNLMYLIPATLLGIKMRLMLYDSLWQYYLLVIGCLLVQIILLEYGILHLPMSLLYAVSLLAVNITILAIMNLSYFKRSNQTKKL